MPSRESDIATPRLVIDVAGLQSLIDSLRGDGYRVVGPTVRDGAIVLAEMSDVAELPRGWADDQRPGGYRLTRREDGAFFGHSVSAATWKHHLFPPEVVSWQARVDTEGIHVEAPAAPARYALLGLRACDLAAIAVQDRVLMQTAHPDRDYAARRERALLIAVNCAAPSGSCFCTSMGTGPRATAGHDLALTELVGDGEGPARSAQVPAGAERNDAGAGHRFLVEVGSERGAAAISALRASPPSASDLDAAAAVWSSAAARVDRSLDTAGLPGLLMRNLEHPRWDLVAERCLSCANCTLVCPTCFCVDLREAGGLDPRHAEQHRVWASCFSVDHSQLHGGSMRWSARARYRQWMTHKLATWHDQFGTSGCVGCGRCITWCPAGIDITEEAAAIRATDGLTGPPTRARG